MSWLSRWIRRKTIRCSATLHFAQGETTLQERKFAYQNLHAVRAIHTLLAGAANRLNWQVLRSGEVDEIESRFADSHMGLHFANWMVLGETHIGPAWSVAMRGDGIVVQHPAPPLAAARTLLERMRQLERAQLQALWRWGATTLIVPSEQALAPTPAELEQAREALSRSLREAGVGGVDILPTRMEFVELKNKPADYAFSELSIQLTRELCNLFAIDSSLLNDPENKTYSNKTEAQKALYVNVIIPNAYLFSELINRELILAKDPRTLQPDPSPLEPLAEEREKQAAFLIQLYDKGIITTQELREKLNI